MKASNLVKVCLLSGILSLVSAQEVLQDIAGRTVKIPEKVEHILLGEGRLIAAIALLEGAEPLKRMIGWQGDFKKLDPQTYNIYKEKFPEIDDITLIGDTTPQSVSPEKVLTLNPDIAIFGLSGHGPATDSELVKQLEKAGIPVVFVDFRNSPLKNTIPSMRILGKALHREEKAEQYIAFYEENLKKVTDIIAKIPEKDRVSVFIELKAGSSEDCCVTAGKGNMGDFIDVAGGINIAKNLLPSILGTLNLEKVISSDPQIYIASGSSAPIANRPGVPFGMQTSKEQALVGLKSILERKGISTLSAVKNGNVYGIWHNYYNSPYNIVAIQSFAKWFYPNEFKDLDPEATLKEIHQQFLAIDPVGTYWINLK
ncbi:iron ABC transporter substrate-binding protein [Gammaproteobacteria bacterium]|nr:iron ABC transporter substrate-binding protein [Gammaproteobacteria bacterium]